MAKESVKEEDVKKTTEEKAEELKDSKAEGTEKEPEKAEEKEPGKFKAFLGKCGRGAKKALPYVGAFVAGAGTVAGALLVAAAKSNSNADNTPLLEEDPELQPFDEAIEGDYEVTDVE